MRRPRRIIAATLVAGFLATACGGSADAPASADAASPASSASSESPGVRVVSPTDAASILSSPPEGLVVLDVRTPEEFASGHIDGAAMIDFYESDFAAQLATLDRDAPYLVYCRSGNRSGQTRALMADLGFTNVADVDGGVLAWTDAGLPLIAG